MCDVGRLRIPRRTLLLIIDGNIGHLKSTLLKALREGANVVVIEGKDFFKTDRLTIKFCPLKVVQ